MAQIEKWFNELIYNQFEFLALFDFIPQKLLDQNSKQNKKIGFSFKPKSKKNKISKNRRHSNFVCYELEILANWLRQNWFLLMDSPKWQQAVSSSLNEDK